MKALTGQQQQWIRDLEAETGVKVLALDEYMADEISWDEFWRLNTKDAAPRPGQCSCRLIEIMRRPRPATMDTFRAEGVGFVQDRSVEGASDRDWFYLCLRCSRPWRETEIESGQYWSRHMYPA